MQCKHCGSQLSEGVAFCQQCGTPVTPPPSSIAPTVAAFPPSYNNPSSGANYNPSSIPPTVAASPPAYNTPGSDANYNPSSIPPTVAASPPAYGNPGPYTNYNPSSLPGGGNQGYEAAQNPYASVPPYSQPQPSNVAPPPPSNVPSYNAPFQSNNMSYGGAVVPPFAAAPVKPKSKVGLIIGIVIAVLLVACVGSAVLVANLPHSGSQANTTTATPSAPSGNTIDSTAASIVTNIQMASDVDTVTAKPIKLAKDFKTYASIYSTFDLNFSSTTVSAQDPGYVEAKFYLGGTLVSSSDPLTVDDSTVPGGYFKAEYYHATRDGVVELYWCKKSNCSDAALAGIATFTVS